MPIHALKLPYVLIGLSLGYAFLLQDGDSTSDLLFLFALPVALFAAMWIRDKERVLLAIVMVNTVGIF